MRCVYSIGGKGVLFIVALAALLVTACNGKAPVLPGTEPRIAEITGTSVTINWDAARLPGSGEGLPANGGLGYEVYIHDDRDAYDQLARGGGRRGDIFLTPGVRTGGEPSVTLAISGNPGRRWYVSIMARNYDDEGLGGNVKTYALYPLVVAQVPEGERQDAPPEHWASAQEADEGEYTVVSFTRQNEVVALAGRAPPEAVRQIFSYYKAFVEPVGWNGAAFALRTVWYNDVMPGGGYALRIFDTAGGRSLENDLLLIHIDWDEPDKEAERAKQIALAKTRWPELLERYGIRGAIEQPEREIKEGGYQVFDGSDISCYFDYELYGAKQWNEEIEWRLIVEAGGKRKTIARSRDASEAVCGKRILGYYRSPHQNTIAVMVVNVVRGFEGAVDTGLSFYGCDMDWGFE
jgi:hypothetical protein